MYKLNLFDKLSFMLVIIGSINWGIIALFNFNLITFLCFGIAPLIRTIYLIITLASLNMLWGILKCNNFFKKSK